MDYPVIVDNDPDFPGYFSLFTNVPGAINAEIAGKIGERKYADKLAELWNRELGNA